MPRVFKVLNLPEDRISELEILSNNHLYPEAALHAKIILKCTSPTTTRAISEELGVDKDSIKKWRDRYEAQGIAGLYPKHGGGSVQSVENLEDKIQSLLNGKDKDWTVPLLIEQTGASEYAVNAALRKLEITLQRKRLWEYETASELIEKSLDVVGLYLTCDTRIIALCCNSSEGLIPCRGTITTRNKEFAVELERSLPVSLTDAVIASTKYAAESRSGSFRTATVFLDDLLSGLPTHPDTEYYLIIQSSTSLKYKGKHIVNMFPIYASSEEEWINEVNHLFIQLAAKRDPSFASTFISAVRQFTQKSTSTSEPFIWKKQLEFNSSHFDPQPVQADVSTEERQKLMFQEAKSFDDHLISIFPEEIEENELQSAMIAVVRSTEGVDYRITISPEKLPAPESFAGNSRDSFMNAINQLEEPLIKLRNEAGKQAMALYLDIVKKNRF